jgi:hypothetical protein
MINFSNFEKINDESYVWRNFLNSQICDDAFRESWELSQTKNKEVRKVDKIELLQGEVNKKIIEKVEKFFEKTNFFTGSFLHWYTEDNLWFGMHRDDEAFDKTPFKKAWAGIIYLDNMVGGELLYPTYNNYVKTYKGDMIIHTAEVPHAATPVTGHNKRTITYVIYDKTKPINPEEEPYGEIIAKEKDRQVLACTDWLKTDFGKRWIRDYNIIIE